MIFRVALMYEDLISVLISHITLAGTRGACRLMVGHSNAEASGLDRVYIGYQDVPQR